MADKNIHPVYVMTHYVWEVLSRNDPSTWNRANYNNKIPVVPLGEEPDIVGYGHPHIVFGYTMDNSPGQLHVRQRGAVSYVISSPNFETLTRTVNILSHALGRFDETAADINNFSSTKDYFRGIRFGYVRVSFVEGGSPETTEGGDQSAVINLTFECIMEHEDVITDVVS